MQNGIMLSTIMLNIVIPCTYQGTLPAHFISFKNYKLAHKATVFFTGERVQTAVV